MKNYTITTLFTLYLLVSQLAFGQNKTLSGSITDEETKESLAFVNIITPDGKAGVSSDIDGKFQISVPENTQMLLITSVGYEKLEYILGTKTSRIQIKLKRKSYLLTELEITPGDNPAHRIIKNVVLYRDTNNPKKLQSFAYTSYDKMVVTLDMEHVQKADSILEIPDSIGTISEMVKDKDILIMENVVEKKFLAPERNHEKIIASRVSGLKDPLIVFVVSQIQSTSFYDEIIHMVNNHYINPISQGSLNKYYFQMEDTTYSAQGDTIFSISFVPYSNTNFDGLKGVLNISTNKWAIANVKAGPASGDLGFNIEIQQMYDFIEGHWFPIQLNTNIIFNNMTAQSKGGEQANFIGIGKSYHRDIVLNPELVKRQFSFAEIELDPNAGYKNDQFWDQYRVDSLTNRNKRTYEFMDSVGQAMNFDKKVKQAETIFTGKIPWGKFDIPLNKFVGYNNYEGFWAGAGIRTNKRISTKWELGGYGAYAFRAEKAKYGFDGQFLLFRPYALKIFASYSKDFMETAGTEFYNNQLTVFNPETFKDFFVSRANYTERKELFLRFRTLRFVFANVGLRLDSKASDYGYYFMPSVGGDSSNHFVFSEIQMGFRIAYKERYMDNSRMMMSMGTRYPVVYFNYYKGIKGLFGGDYNYHRFDLRITKSFYTKYLGETTFDLQGGVVIGDIPHTNLYRGPGTYGIASFFVPSSFGSMSSFEFLSDRYVSGFFSHNFGNLLYQGKKFKPELMLITNVGFGWLSKPELHRNISFNTMEKGYFESGILINSLLNLTLYKLGVGATYRYGAYSYAKFMDNVSFRLTLTLPVKPAFNLVE